MIGTFENPEPAKKTSTRKSISQKVISAIERANLARKEAVARQKAGDREYQPKSFDISPADLDFFRALVNKNFLKQKLEQKLAQTEILENEIWITIDQYLKSLSKGEIQSVIIIYENQEGQFVQTIIRIANEAGAPYFSKTLEMRDNRTVSLQGFQIANDAIDFFRYPSFAIAQSDHRQKNNQSSQNYKIIISGA